jgi:hypothetical protein
VFLWDSTRTIFRVLSTLHSQPGSVLRFLRTVGRIAFQNAEKQPQLDKKNRTKVQLTLGITQYSAKMFVRQNLR